MLAMQNWSYTTKIPTATTFKRSVLEACYEEVYPVIVKAVDTFVSRHGGHYDDLLADATTFLFLRAYEEYSEADARRVTFESHVYTWVWFGLFDAYRTASGARRRHNRTRVPLKPNEYVAPPANDFRLSDFTALLTPDTATVATLLVGAPEDHTPIVWRNGKAYTLAAAIDAKGGGTRNFKSTVREYLRGIGWTAMRINQSFAELKEALA